MEALLLANVASVLFLTGLAWFVQVVHYPLFAEVDPDRFLTYHEAHSRLTTKVVLAPMIIDLSTSIALLADPPGNLLTLTLVGAALAVATWLLTGLGAVPAHRALGAGFEPRAHRRLLSADRLRTLAWSAHAAVVLALLSASI